MRIDDEFLILVPRPISSNSGRYNSADTTIYHGHEGSISRGLRPPTLKIERKTKVSAFTPTAIDDEV